MVESVKSHLKNKSKVYKSIPHPEFNLPRTQDSIWHDIIPVPYKEAPVTLLRNMSNTCVTEKSPKPLSASNHLEDGPLRTDVEDGGCNTDYLEVERMLSIRG